MKGTGGRGPAPKHSAITLDDLPENWRSHLEVTRNLGTAWLQKKESDLLQIPSAIVPETANFLFNPPLTQQNSALQEHTLIPLMPVSRSSNPPRLHAAFLRGSFQIWGSAAMLPVANTR